MTTTAAVEIPVEEEEEEGVEVGAVTVVVAIVAVQEVQVGIVNMKDKVVNQIIGKDVIVIMMTVMEKKGVQVSIPVVA